MMMKKVLPVLQRVRGAVIVIPVSRAFNTQQGKNQAPMVATNKFQPHLLPPVALLQDVLTQQFALYFKSQAYMQRVSENASMQKFLNGFYRIISLLYERNVEHLKNMANGNVNISDRIPLSGIAKLNSEDYDKKVLLDLLATNKRILAQLIAYEKSPLFVQNSAEGLAVRELKEKHVYASFIIRTYMLQRSM
jgi:hypothetical protein